MRNPIENLGDYNEVRMDLQKAGGSKEALYKAIGDTAVAKKAPMYMLVGGTIAIGGIGAINLAIKGIQYWKERRQLLKDESELKRQFMDYEIEEERGDEEVVKSETGGAEQQNGSLSGSISDV